MRHVISKQLSIALVATMALVLAAPASAYHPNHPVGYTDPERAVRGFAERVDIIDLNSGALSVVIPIGPWSLTYNSSVWQYTVDGATGVITASPDRENTAGFGWHLGWGELYHPGASYNGTGRWLYVGADGGRHTFYETLHRDDDDDGDPDNRIFYTRDGSYLRMRLEKPSGACWAEIEFPDGSGRRFKGSCGPQTPLRLIKVWNAFGSESDPDLTITYEVDPDDPNGTEDTLRRVVDRYGLTHKVFLSDNIGGTLINLMNRIVTRVEIESFGGTPAIYTFHYRRTHVDVSCKDTSSSTDPRIPLPHLTGVDLPDGSSYTMEEDGDLLYYNECDTIGGRYVEDLPGVLRGLNLPTGGKIRWEFEEREFPPTESNSVFASSASVKKRKLYSAGPVSADTELGTWSYKWTAIPWEPLPNGEVTDPEMHIEVEYPTGDCSKHFFNAIYWVDVVTPSGKPRGWETGLPFAYSRPSEDGTIYLSSEAWTSTDAEGSCTGTLERSTYLRFRHDTTPGAGFPTYPQADWHNTNRAAEAQRVVYHDPAGDRTTETTWSEFDGLGHFRRQVDTGDFWAGSLNAERRETVFGFTRVTGVYPSADYTPVQVTDPWVLGIYDAVEVSEPDALGETTVKTEYGFEDATGFLTCRRVLSSGTDRRANDLLVVRTHDARGRVVDELSYGSDTQELSTEGDDCGTVPEEPTYWVTHEYDASSPARVRTRARMPDGTDGPFLLYDVDVEPKTGLLVAARDATGFEVSYTYDSLGRPVSITPEEGALLEYKYVTATAQNQPRVATTASSQQDGSELTKSVVVLDDLGRLSIERQRLPGGVWSSRERQYNARGWTTSISQWGRWNEEKAVTEYREFDPFGRPGVIRPPDGEAHDVRITRVGEYQVTQSVSRALAGGEAYVDRLREYDRYGRLRRVEEPSGEAGTMVPTTYSYDVGGRLTRVVSGLPGPTGVTQVRSYSYDNRGFLLSETLPEKGVTGNGTVLYQDYDAAGRAHGKVDGPNSLAFTYDLIGRPLKTLDRNHGLREVTELVWNTEAGPGLGKLGSALRYNYVDLPWNGAGEDEVIVTQAFSYDGLANAVSQKTTSIEYDQATSPQFRFVQGFTYNELGDIASTTFPRCDLSLACTGPAAVGRTVTYTHDQGRLIAVPGWASSMTYHPSGAWDEIVHANGVTDHQDVDEQFSRRPEQLYTSEVSPGFDSGVMSYDGAGNLKTMGTHAFAYDAVGRLVDAAYLAGAFHQSYSYDPFGNLTAVSGYTTGVRSFSVDSKSNRLNKAKYDGAGNLVGVPKLIPLNYLSYDTANRLVAQGNQRYLYDAFGERTMMVVADASEESGSFYLRDLGQRFVTRITLDDGVWTRDRDYVYGGDRLLARASTGSSADFHFHLDHLGSVRLVTDGSGAYHDEHFFLPYGELEGGSTNFEDSPLFTGHERDGSTGADYMHARHYLWSLGRFFSVDPLGGDAAAPQSLNRYAYVMGSPINYTDPTGERIKLCDGSDTHGEPCTPTEDMGPLHIFWDPTANEHYRDPRRPREQVPGGRGGRPQDPPPGPGPDDGGGDEPEPDPDDGIDMSESKADGECLTSAVFVLNPAAQAKEAIIAAYVRGFVAPVAGLVSDFIMALPRLVSSDINTQMTESMNQPSDSMTPITNHIMERLEADLPEAMEAMHHKALAACGMDH